jgi:hypothetical protein
VGGLEWTHAKLRQIRCANPFVSQGGAEKQGMGEIDAPDCKKLA